MATKRWLGKALNVTQETTVTFANTWATADTVTLTISGLDLIVTIGDDSEVADCAAALSAAINAADKDGDIVGTGSTPESRNVGGQVIMGLQELSAAASGAVVTIKHNTAGVPFSLSVSATTAGSGTTTAATAGAATGRHFASNADNWSGASLPASGDTIRFDNGDVSCFYGLDHFRNNAVDINLIVTTDYLGKIGLPETNAGGYLEYRNRFLELRDIALTGGTASWLPGEKGLDGNGPYYLDMAGQDYVVKVVDAGPVNKRDPAVVIVGGTITNLEIVRGAVVFEPEDTPLSSAYTGLANDFTIGSGQTFVDDVYVVFGANVSPIVQNSTMKVYGGEVHLKFHTDQGYDVTSKIYGGEVYFEADGNEKSVSAYGGTVFLNGTGTYATAEVRGGAIDCNQDGRSKTITLLNLHYGSYLDQADAVTITNIFVGGQLKNVTVEGNLGLGYY